MRAIKTFYQGLFLTHYSRNRACIVFIQIRRIVRVAVVAVFGLAIMNCAAAAMAAPPTIGVPEVDPSSAVGAMSVLAAGGLILAERLGFRRK